MKKYISLGAIVIALSFLLCACGRLSGKPEEGLKIFTGTETLRGSFDGTMEEGVPVGSGTFTADEGWTYTGSFAEGAFDRGDVEGMPLRVKLGENSFSAVYTGQVTSLQPEGEGSLAVGDGVVFTGTFAAGLPSEGDAVCFPCTARINGEDLSGEYTGRLSGGMATGEGEFLLDGQGRTLRYVGGWEAGAPRGAGTLSDDGFTLYVNGETNRGRYEGATEDGLSAGEGTFTARNSDNIDYRYTGEWKDGVFDGQGELRFDSELYYDRVGTFTEGRFTPDMAELLNAYGSVVPYFTLSEETKAFLEKYPELCDSGRDVPDYRSESYRLDYINDFSYEMYVKDPEKYQGRWMFFFNYYILQRSADTSFGDDYQCTRILASNTVWTNPIECLVFGEVSNLDKASRFNMYGIPLGMSTYTNADGEQIPAIVILVGSIGVF